MFNIDNLWCLKRCSYSVANRVRSIHCLHKKQSPAVIFLWSEIVWYCKCWKTNVFYVSLNCLLFPCHVHLDLFIRDCLKISGAGKGAEPYVWLLLSLDPLHNRGNTLPTRSQNSTKQCLFHNQQQQEAKYEELKSVYPKIVQWNFHNRF